MKTPLDVQHDLSKRFKALRLARNLTQQGLAKRSRVSWGSLKRFEQKGLIAFDALLRLALVLDCLYDFDNIGAGDPAAFESKSLDDILAPRRERRPGRIK